LSDEPEQQQSKTEKKEQNTISNQGVTKKPKFISKKDFALILKEIQNCFFIDPCYVKTLRQHTAHNTISGSPTVMQPKALYKIIKPTGDDRNKYCVKARGLNLNNPYSYIQKQENAEKTYLSGVTMKQFKKWFKCDEVAAWMKDNKIELKDATHEEICPLDIKKLLKIWKDNPLYHKHAMEKLIDWTGQRDQIIKDAILSAYFPIPLNKLEWQSFQGNVIMLTNSSAGKSWAYYNMTGTTPSEHFTQRGLFGGYNSDESFEEGAMAGCGMEMIDEFSNKERKEDENNIIQDLLNYNTFGKVVRKQKGRPSCTGTKTVILSGNIVHHFKKVMQYLDPDLKSTEMLGRRYPYFIYTEVPQYKIKEAESLQEKTFKDTYRNVLETAFFEFEMKIWKAFEKNKSIIIADEDFEKKLLDLAARAEEHWLVDFIKGTSLSTQSIKFMALKQYFLLNIDKILLGEITQLKEEHRKELDAIYERKKSVILNSFGELVQEREKFVLFTQELTRLGVNLGNTIHLSNEIVTQIATTLSIHNTTVYRWWNRVQSIRGIRRT
jgi:hypothetical protein